MKNKQWLPFDIHVNVSTDQEAFSRVWNHFITHRHTPGLSAYDPSRPWLRNATSSMIRADSLRAVRDHYSRGDSSWKLEQVTVLDWAIEQAGVSMDLVRRMRVYYSVAKFTKTGSFRGHFAKAMRDIARVTNVEVPNDSDQMPVRWSSRVKLQPPTQTLRELADTVPEADAWLGVA